MIDKRFPDFTRLPGSSRTPRFHSTVPSPPLPPLVQIASVARGRSSFMDDTLRSLQDQTLVRWVWVVVDHTDDSAGARDVMTRLTGEPRVRVISQTAAKSVPPLGLAAVGDTPYICFLRPGDLLEPTALEAWTWSLATSSESVAVTSSVVRFGAVEALSAAKALGSGGYPSDERTPGTLMLSRSAYEKLGGIPAEWNPAEEIEGLAHKIASREGHVAVIQPNLVWCRVHDHEDKATGKYSILPKVVLQRPQSFPPRLTMEPPFTNPLHGVGHGVLVVIPNMFHGGAERAALDQAAELAKRGWRVTIAALARVDHTWRSAFAAVTADVHVPHEYSEGWGDWDRGGDTARFLSYLVESRHIDVVLVGGTMVGYGIIPLLRCRHPNLAAVAVRHAVDLPLLSFEFLNLFDRILVSTDRLVQQHMELGVEEGCIRRIVTGIDTDKWRPDPEQRAILRRRLNLPVDAPVLVYSSRLSPDKQPLVFAETMALLRNRGLDVFALVTGAGSEQAPLLERLAALKLTERVRMMGEVEDCRLPGIMATGDMAFLPSQREGIALSLLEGMACGLPFVGTAASSQDEVVTEDVGALIPRSDPETEARAYADVIEPILRNQRRLAEMGRCARTRINEFWSHEHMGSQLESALKEAMARARSGEHNPGPEILARCLSALSVHAMCVDMCHTANMEAHRAHTAVRTMVSTLEALGYDHRGRPLSRPTRSWWSKPAVGDAPIRKFLYASLPLPKSIRWAAKRAARLVGQRKQN